MKTLAQIISWVMMPMLMPIYALMIVMFSPSQPIDLSAGDSLFLIPLQNKIVLLLYYFMFAVFSPGILYLFLKKINVISSVEMENKEERKIPLVIMSLSCLFLFYILTSYDFHLPKFIYGLCLSGTLIISLFIVINRFLKISLHAAGVGILSGFVLAYFFEQIYFKISILALVFIIAGLVITTRLYLEKHTPKELVLGYSISFIVTFILNLFYPFG